MLLNLLGRIKELRKPSHNTIANQTTPIKNAVNDIIPSDTEKYDSTIQKIETLFDYDKLFRALEDWSWQDFKLEFQNILDSIKSIDDKYLSFNLFSRISLEISTICWIWDNEMLNSTEVISRRNSGLKYMGSHEFWLFKEAYFNEINTKTLNWDHVIYSFLWSWIVRFWLINWQIKVIDWVYRWSQTDIFNLLWVEWIWKN